MRFEITDQFFICIESGTLIKSILLMIGRADLLLRCSWLKGLLIVNYIYNISGIYFLWFRQSE